MYKKPISFREAATPHYVWKDKGEPEIIQYESPGDIPTTKLPEVGKKTTPTKGPSKSLIERAPIPLTGPKGFSAPFYKIDSNFYLQYSPPSFDSVGSIKVLFLGKMPYTLGHNIQFSGIVESDGIGKIFTLSQEALDSIRRFVFVEMPKVDKFSDKILNQIYQDTIRIIGENVPIKTIYQSLKQNYPDQFLKSLEKLKIKEISDRFLREVISNQKAFYKQGKHSSIINKKIITAAYSKGDKVRINFDKLSPEKVKEFKNKGVTSGGKYDGVAKVQKSDNITAVVSTLRDDGQGIALEVPVSALGAFQGSDRQQREHEFYGYKQPGAPDEEKIQKKSEMIRKKLLTKKPIDAKEALTLFQNRAFDNMSRGELIKTLSLSPQNTNLIMSIYEKNKSNSDFVNTGTKVKFIIFKLQTTVNSPTGQPVFPLTTDETDLMLKAFPDVNTMMGNEDLALAFVVYKLSKQIKIRPMEIEFLIQADEFSGQRFQLFPRAFEDYYATIAKTEDQFAQMDPKFKRFMMQWKKQNNKTFSRVEQDDPMFTALGFQRTLKNPPASTPGAKNTPAAQATNPSGAAGQITAPATPTTGTSGQTPESTSGGTI